MGNPRISIVTPVFNRLHTLPDLLASLQSQKSEIDWEWIAVDDGSTDGGSEWLETAASSDSRIRPTRREGNPKGANRCRNQGMDAASGEFLIFLDSDDILLPGCLQGRIVAMESVPDIDFLVWQAEIFNQEPGDLGKLWNYGLGGDPVVRFLSHDPPWQSSGPIWRLDYLRTTGVRWQENLPSWQDFGWHVEILFNKPRFQMVSERDYGIRMRGDEHRTTADLYEADSEFHLRAHQREIVRLAKLARASGQMSSAHSYWFAANFGLFANDQATGGNRLGALWSLLKGGTVIPGQLPYLLRAVWHHLFWQTRLNHLAELSGTESGFLPGKLARRGRHRFRGNITMLDDSPPVDSSVSYFSINS